MSRAVLGPQAPTNHAIGCPLAAWSLVDLAAKISTSCWPDGSWAHLISSSSRYLARLRRQGKMVPRIPWFQGPVAPIGQSKLEPKVNKVAQKPSPLAPKSPPAPWSLGHLVAQSSRRNALVLGSLVTRSLGSRSQARLRSIALALGPLVAWHQAGNDVLVPRFLGLTFSREQGTVAAGYPRSPWKLGPLVPGPAKDPGSIANLMTWSLDRIGNLITGNRSRDRRVGCRWPSSRRAPILARQSPRAGQGGSQDPGCGPQFVPRRGTTLWHM